MEGNGYDHTLLTTVIPMKRLNGFHDENFDSNQQIAKDSGGFALLKDPTLAEELDVESLQSKDTLNSVSKTTICMTLDFPILMLTIR